MNGGLGKDVFIYESGNDTILDYMAGQDTIKISNGTISEYSYSGKNLVFKIGSNSLTVQNVKGKKVTVTDSSGNTTTQIYSEKNTNARTLDIFDDNNFLEKNTNARTLDIFDDNNFLTDEPSIADISDKKFTVTNIQPVSTNELETPKISYSGEK